MKKLYRQSELTYEEHDDYVFPHIMAMTGEKLHSKAEIAFELGVRDKSIIEIEKKWKRDVAVYEQIIRDQRDTICLFMPSSQDAINKLKQRDLEMHAKGVEDAIDAGIDLGIIENDADLCQQLRKQAKGK